MSAASRAFRCVQGWLLEKPAGWVDRDAPDLVAAAMVQQPRSKRPREDALLQAERSHQDSLLEDRNRLEERLEEAEEELWETKDDLGALRSGVNEVCGAVSESQPNSRAQKAELALRFFETYDEWAGLVEYWDVVRDIPGADPYPPPHPDVRELVERWRADIAAGRL